MKMSESYTLKEMLEEVRNEQRQAISTQSHIVTTLEAIDKHLEKLNSKVADHEKRISTNESFIGKAQMVWGAVVLIIGYAANKIL